jgi:hypothetical protein
VLNEEMEAAGGTEYLAIFRKPKLSSVGERRPK